MTDLLMKQQAYYTTVKAWIFFPRQKEDGRYEIISGHRRRKACELAGLEMVPAEIKELTRDEAITGISY